MTTIEAATLRELPPIFKKFGEWAITPKGLYYIPHDYNIIKDRISEPGWIEHMSEKDWVNMEDFKRALFTAPEPVNRNETLFLKG